MQDIVQAMIMGAEISKEDYKLREEKIRLDLLALQKQLATQKKSVLILMNGVEGSGKGATTKKLLEWLDARGVETTAFWTQGSDTADHPPLYRFWNKLPAHGRMGIFFGSWYTEPIIARVFKDINKTEFESRLADICKLEQMLTAEGIILIKLWMYLSPEEQKLALRSAHKKAATRWRIAPIVKKFLHKRKRFHKIDVETLNATNLDKAPWIMVDSRSRRYREIFTGEILARRLKAALAAPPPEYRGVWKASTRPYLADLDLALKLSDSSYEDEFKKLGERIAYLSDQLSATKKSLVLVFEGADAAGKGGAIRRVLAGIDPRHYQVNAVSAPSDIEKAHPYLWRFWQKSPPAGKIYIFDRSWYGRVLVERIEGFCSEAEWQRAFNEINDFEKALYDSKTTIRKFYLSISPEEQLARFRDRQTTPYKQYKLTEEDWRNRDKWNAYQTAANDMFENTSTPIAPWILIEANDKNHARIKVLKNVATALTAALS